MSSSSRCAKLDRPTRRLALVALAAALGGSCVAAQPAAPAELRSEVPTARLQGHGQLRFLGLHVYDIRWWTPTAVSAHEALSVESALEIEYARALKGPLIAERSIKEMRRVGEFSVVDEARWLGQMKQLFPDVQTGDRITGVNRRSEGVRFYVNGRLAGEVRDAAFAPLFFGIWLSPRTSEPKLRAELLGTAP